MPASLLTNSQSRWTLHIVLALLSAVAIASSAPPGAGGVAMYSGNAGDLRGLAVILGATGLGGVIVLRLASILLPRPWRIYTDRLEFTFTTMLYVCWTSATMAFSAFTLSKGVCSLTISELYLPTCPLLTFDLALLHLLSTSTLALILVILSTVLSPKYHLSLSALADTSKLQSEERDVFLMWDLALASPPGSPQLGPVGRGGMGMATGVGSGGRSYGATEATVPLMGVYAQPSNPYDVTANTGITAIPPKKRDKFAQGRLWTYIPLGLCSLAVLIAAAVVLGQSHYVLNSVIIIVVASLSLSFVIGFLVVHFRQRNAKITEPERQWTNLRRDRALEVGFAGILFLLWPLAAIVYTLFPPTPNRPCANPSSSINDPLSLPADLETICFLTTTTVTLAWLASWLILARILGLIFPMPDVGRLPIVRSIPTRDGEEGRSLLRNAEHVEGVRPQVKWGRMVAGEAFELGDDDDETT